MTGPSAEDIHAAADQLSGQIIATPTLAAPALAPVHTGWTHGA